MNKLVTIIVIAICSGLSSLVSSLLLLFSGENVKIFSDITQVQYAFAVLTAFGTTLAVVLSYLKEAPSQQKNSQSGYFMPQFAGVLVVLSLAVVMLPACTSQQVTPDKIVESTSLSIEQIAIQIDAAQKAGQISNEREDALLDQLKAINSDLRLAYSLTGPSQTQSLDDINVRLIELRAQLAKEKKK